MFVQNRNLIAKDRSCQAAARKGGCFGRLEINSTCAVGCSFEHLTHSHIRKTRACALLRLHSQPHFAHLEVDCTAQVE